MGAISIRNVEKVYGHGAKANKVIHGVSAEIADGEFVVIVGPSGCGKSTLLRMVAGLEEITGGEIAIAGRVVNDIEPLLGRKPRELSGGQRQRVALARAIVKQPRVFLFDEPLSNLDAKLRAQTRLEIQKLHRELGVTSLFVTHDQVEAMTLGQRLIVMNAGHMEQIGTPEDVYARPATTFVAGFIGSPPMNLLRGRATGATFTVDGATLPLATVAPRDGEIVLGLRPEHAELRDGAGGWPLQVEMIEMLGAERLVHGRVGTLPFTVRQDSTLAAPKAGDTVAVRAAGDHLHWFDAATQRRL